MKQVLNIGGLYVYYSKRKTKMWSFGCAWIIGNLWWRWNDRETLSLVKFLAFAKLPRTPIVEYLNQAGRDLVRIPLDARNLSYNENYSRRRIA